MTEPSDTTRKPTVQKEWCVQRGVVRFVKRCVAVQHEFASHDRGRARSAQEHIYEAARGLRPAWPDTELVLEGGKTFRCELKAPGVKIAANGDQMKMLQRLHALGHPVAWANSVTMYAQKAAWRGVPLSPNWMTVAAHEDELVAADIRAQEVKAEAKRSGTHKPSRKSRPRVAPGRIAKAHKAGVWRMPL